MITYWNLLIIFGQVRLSIDSLNFLKTDMADLAFDYVVYVVSLCARIIAKLDILWLVIRGPPLNRQGGGGGGGALVECFWSKYFEIEFSWNK